MYLIFRTVYIGVLPEINFWGSCWKICIFALLYVYIVDNFVIDGQYLARDLLLIFKKIRTKVLLICGVPSWAPCSSSGSVVWCDMVLCRARVLLFGRKGIPHIPAGFEQLYVCILTLPSTAAASQSPLHHHQGQNRIRNFPKPLKSPKPRAKNIRLLQWIGGNLDMEKIMEAGH